MRQDMALAVSLIGAVIMGGCGKRTPVWHPPTVEADWVRGIAVVAVQSAGALLVSPTVVTTEAETWLKTRFDTVVTRHRLAAILGEHSLATSGLVDPDSAVRAGQLAGANAVLYLDIIDAYDRRYTDEGSIAFPIWYEAGVTIIAELIDVETGEVAWTKTESVSPTGYRIPSWGNSATEAANNAAAATTRRVLFPVCGYWASAVHGGETGQSVTMLARTAGVTIRQQPDPRAATHGVSVKAVQRRSQATHAGIRPGDVIVAVNGHPVDDLPDLSRALANVTTMEPQAGTVKLRVIREGETVILALPH